MSKPDEQRADIELVIRVRMVNGARMPPHRQPKADYELYPEPDRKDIEDFINHTLRHLMDNYVPEGFGINLPNLPGPGEPLWPLDDKGRSIILVYPTPHVDTLANRDMLQKWIQRYSETRRHYNRVNRQLQSIRRMVAQLLDVVDGKET